MNVCLMYPMRAEMVRAPCAANCLVADDNGKSRAFTSMATEFFTTGCVRACGKDTMKHKESRREIHGGLCFWFDYIVTKKKRRAKRTPMMATMISFFLNFPVARVISV